MRRKVSDSKKNQKGILTIDFIFSFAMVIGLFQLFYVITYTLMVAQITQYMTFAASRQFFAGHIDVTNQERLAQDKFDELSTSSSVSGFFKNAFKLTGFEAGEFTEYSTPTSWRQKFIGVRTNFESKVLDVNIPFLGRTGSELEGQGFTSVISSYLYREPSAKECNDFNAARAKAILDLDGKYQQAGSYGFTPSNVGVFSDNGC